MNSIAGRTENALANLRNAAAAALRHGAVGYLVTDWGDNGHWQPLAVSLLPFAWGAGLAWSGVGIDPVAAEETAAATLNLHHFGDASNRLAQIAAELGRVDLLLGLTIHNSATLFQIMQPAYGTLEGFMAAEGVDAPAMQARIEAAQARLQELLAELAEVAPTQPAGVQSRAELTWAAEMLLHSYHRGLWLLDGRPAQDTRPLADDADRLIATFNGQWHARYRPGGYANAHARMMTMRNDYAGA